MSFFGKFKSNASPSSPSLGNAAAKKDPNLPPPTALEKHLADITGPARLDGSDKFFGFENYSSTCYCNSIIQCLYYSAPFREHVINFPALPPTNGSASPNGLYSLDTGPGSLPRSPLTSKPPPQAPGPLAANSPARRPIILPGTPQAQTQKVDDKDSPEYKKKMLMANAPMLDMQLDYADAYGMEESLFTALKDIFEAVISSPQRTGIVSPHKFLEILRKENEMFRSAMHQDAHEFLNLLLNQVLDNVEAYSKQIEAKTNGNSKALTDAMSNAVQRTNATSSTTGWVHDLFEGLLVSETRCLTCENTSQRDEAFMDLSVDLEAHSSVTSCLRKFSEEEMLCERNKFHCDNCGGLQEAEKRMKIKRLPRILALHLKRFKYTEDYNRLQKLFHRVVYPFHLRLFNTTDDAEDQDRLYELYAVVVHIGGGPYHGHYVSIIKTQDRGWLLFDDELVEPVDKSYVQNFFGGEPKTGVQDAKQLACAYVLFYQETTLEAMQKEQEAESQAASRPSAEPSNVAASPVTSAGLWSNGLRHMQTVSTPTEEEPEPFANLAHAMTAPPLTSPGAIAASPLLTTTTNMTNEKKSKKDIKKEEKERKAAEKEAEKVARARRKEEFDARRERYRQSEAELQAVLEASKLSAAEETARVSAATTAAASNTNGTAADAPATATAAASGGGGSGTSNGKDGLPALARFKSGSMSLRQKPQFWSRKDKEKENERVAAAVATSPRLDEKSGGEDRDGGANNKKNRFSLGRKKSAVL